MFVRYYGDRDFGPPYTPSNYNNSETGKIRPYYANFFLCDMVIFHWGFKISGKNHSLGLEDKKIINRHPKCVSWKDMIKRRKIK